MFSFMRERLLVKSLEDDLQLLLEQVSIDVLVHHRPTQRFDLAGVIAAARPPNTTRPLDRMSAVA